MVFGVNKLQRKDTEVDKVWDQLKPLIGEEMGAERRAVLKNQDNENR